MEVGGTDIQFKGGKAQVKTVRHRRDSRIQCSRKQANSSPSQSTVVAT